MRTNAIALALLSLAAGCGGFSGGKGGATSFASTVAPASSGSSTTITRDPRGYSFDSYYQPSGPTGDAVTAIAPSPARSGAFYVANTFLGTVQVIDGSSTATEGQLTQNVSSFAVVGSTVLAATSNPRSPAAGEIYWRAPSAWTLAIDPGRREATVAAFGSSAYAFAGEVGRDTATVSVLRGSTWSQVATIGSSVPQVAVERSGELWVGGKAWETGGGAARLHHSANGITFDEVLLPGGAPGSTSRVSALASASNGLWIAVETRDATGAITGGAILSYDDASRQTNMDFQLANEAPLALTGADGTVYAGTSSGRLLWRDDSGSWNEEVGIPANRGITALSAFQGVVYVGVRGQKGAEVWKRTPLSGVVISGGGGGGGGGGLKSYLADVKPLVKGDCVNCHTAVPGMMLSSGLTNDTADYNAIRAHADLANPEGSLILKKPTMDGVSHGGGQRFAKGSAPYQTILQWIKDGARFN